MMSARWCFTLQAMLLMVLFPSFVILRDDMLPGHFRNALSNSPDIFSLRRRFTQVSQSALGNLSGLEKPPISHAVPHLFIRIPEVSLLRMQHAIRSETFDADGFTEDAKPYFDAVYTDDLRGRVPVKIKLRGSSLMHHDDHKPSVRIKFKKRDRIEGKKYVELQRPEDALALKNWIPDHLGRQLGLVTEKIDHVVLTINGRYRGVYLRTHRQGDELSRLHGRKSGTYFKSELHYGAKWRSHTYWKTFGRDRTAEDAAHFDSFLNHVRNPADVQAYRQFRDIFDARSYAKWSALMIVTGSAHTDLYHNQSYFLNPDSRKLEALVWDSNSFGIHYDEHLHPNIVFHPVMDAMIRDPHWVHLRNTLIYELLNSSAAPQALGDLIDERCDLLWPALRADSRLCELRIRVSDIPMYVPVAVTALESKKKELKSYIEKRTSYLRGFLADSHVFVEDLGAGSSRVRVQVAGATAVRCRGVTVEDQEFVRLLHPGLSKMKFSVDRKPFAKFVKSVPLTYDLPVSRESLHFENAVTGEPIKAQYGLFQTVPEPMTFDPEALEPF